MADQRHACPAHAGDVAMLGAAALPQGMFALKSAAEMQSIWKLDILISGVAGKPGEYLALGNSYCRAVL